LIHIIILLEILDLYETIKVKNHSDCKFELFLSKSFLIEVLLFSLTQLVIFFLSSVIKLFTDLFSIQLFIELLSLSLLIDSSDKLNHLDLLITKEFIEFEFEFESSEKLNHVDCKFGLLLLS
jgi:hypothetical protein